MYLYRINYSSSDNNIYNNGPRALRTNNCVHFANISALSYHLQKAENNSLLFRIFINLA